ncbi:uncharacterized protein H6S33_007139 [Morchella sextelata]|uniref:uncharacterized protein n=1 Tax=Morchella sextelata TaxID=1174677 RepID=UPI001D03A7BD|nr:uncharacterized protein H6S33_007139 [Morchella sextelata]KAH0604108.1 hypothetical protein H6S33_007139 [Morchella sextelata]
MPTSKPNTQAAPYGYTDTGRIRKKPLKSSVPLPVQNQNLYEKWRGNRTKFQQYPACFKDLSHRPDSHIAVWQHLLYFATKDPKPQEVHDALKKIRDQKPSVLMRLCVDYQAEHVQGKNSGFWLLISELLEQKSGGVKLKDPQKTVSLIVARRRAEVRMQERESGTVQREDELTQKIDAWIAHEDQLERMESDAAKGNSALAKEAEEAAVHRRNMLVPLGEKRNRDGELDSDREESDESVAKEVRKMRKKRRPVISSERSADTLAVVAGVESLGSGMVTAVRELVASRQPQAHQLVASRQPQAHQNERIDGKF